MKTNQEINIIAINGSPHTSGNTATLMKWVAEGCIKENANIIWINISEKEINYCRGCYHCLRTGDCIIKDDVKEIKELIWNSKGVIVGSPVYEGAPSAQLKTLMDRIALFTLYMAIFDDKWSIGVATSGVAPTNRTAKECATIFGRNAGIICSKTASITGNYTAINEMNHGKLQKKAQKMGQGFVRVIQKNPSINSGSIKYAWTGFLRRHFLKRLITKNPEQFSGVIKYWKKKGWL